jgi:S1-C subfamily serine protease
VVITSYDLTGTARSQGSGFVVDGIIATNLHVVSGAASVEIKTPAGESVFATAIIRTDKKWDLALVRVDKLFDSVLRLAPPRSARVGMRVVAIGSPLGFENTISEGIISGIRSGSTLTGVLQITNPVSPGSSGGPVISFSGLVLGVTTLMAKGGQNINFAVPAHKVSQLLKKGRSSVAEKKLISLGNGPSRYIGNAAERARLFRNALGTTCKELDAVDKVISQAIQVGAPIYNSGDHLACYRVYEGASYKLLYLLEGKCRNVSSTLLAGLKQATTDSTATKKAWSMRRTFDLILGEQTRTK